MSEPRVIVGRFASRPDVEWSVAVGCRLVHKAGGSVCVVTSLHDGRVHLCYSAGEKSWVTHEELWRYYSPAPPESRWLDPKSLPRPDEYLEECCSGGAGKCPYPARDPAPGGGFCAACTLWMEEHPSMSCPGRPVLPPNALTPAPRWLEGPLRCPRVGACLFSMSQPPVLTRLSWIRGDFQPRLKGPRVRRVREGNRFEYDRMVAGWTLA